MNDRHVMLSEARGVRPRRAGGGRKSLLVVLALALVSASCATDDDVDAADEDGAESAEEVVDASSEAEVVEAVATNGSGDVEATPGTQILVGTSLTLAPFSFIDEGGESTGFELDILEAVTDRLDVEYNIVRVPFEQNFTSLNAGIFRVSAAAAFIRCERLEDPENIGRFTVPTYAAGQAISTRTEDIDAVSSLDDLTGLNVGIESIGSTADQVLDEAIANGLDVEKVVFNDNPSLFLALEQGRIDAAIQGEFSSAFVSRDNPAVGVAAPIEGTFTPVGFLLRDGDPLRDQFNATIDELKEEGVIGDLYREWFELDPPEDGVELNVVPEVTSEDVC